MELRGRFLRIAAIHDPRSEGRLSGRRGRPNHATHDTSLNRKEYIFMGLKAPYLVQPIDG